jgi:hypothetical protein
MEPGEGGETGMTRAGKRRQGGKKRAADDRRERAERLTAAVRLGVLIWELIWALIRERLIGGAGPGRLL